MVRLAVAMTDHQQSQFNTQPEKNESVFLSRVFLVRDNPGVLVKKRRSCLLKGHPVLRLIGSALAMVPLEADFTHTYSVTTM